MRRFSFLVVGTLLCFYLNAQDTSPDDWYYIEFVQNGLVVEHQGVNAQLKTAVKAENNKQLWKIEKEGEYINISSKENPDLKIVYDCEGIYIAAINIESGNELALTSLGAEKYALHRILYSRGNAVSQAANLIVKNGDLTKTYAEDENVHVQLVKYQNPVGMTEMSNFVSKVYPNPVTDFLYVETPENAVSISIVNTLGQTVKSLKPKGGVEKIDVSALNVGIYFVKIQKTLGTDIFEIIVNK